MSLNSHCWTTRDKIFWSGSRHGSGAAPELLDGGPPSQRELNDYRKKAVADGQRAYIKYDKLVVNGEAWTIQDLRAKFECIKKEEATKVQEKGGESSNGKEDRHEVIRTSDLGHSSRRRRRDESENSPEKKWRRIKKPTPSDSARDGNEESP